MSISPDEFTFDLDKLEEEQNQTLLNLELESLEQETEAPPVFDLDALERSQASSLTPQENEELLSWGETFGRSIDATQQMGFSFARVLGEATGWERLREFGQRGVEEQEAEIQRKLKQGRVVEASELVKKFQNEDEDLEIGDIGTYLWQASADVTPPLVISFASGWAGLKAGAKMTRSPWGAGIGLAVGLFMPSYVLGTGEVDLEIKERAGEDYKAPRTSLAAGVPIAALDVASLTIMLKPIVFPAVKQFGAEALVDQIVKQGVKKSVAKAAIVNALKAAPIEGLTEGAQAIVEDWAAEYETDVTLPTQEKIDRIIDSFSKGVVGGVVGGAPSGAIGQNVKNRQAPSEEQLADLEEWRDKAKEEVDTLVTLKMQELGELGQLDANQLKELAEANGYILSDIPGAKREEIIEEMYALEREEQWGKVLQREVNKDVGAYLNKEDLVAEYREELEEKSDVELADYLEEQFGSLEGFSNWLIRNDISPTDTEGVREAMAEQAATSYLHAQGSTDVSGLGMFHFVQYVEDLSNTFTREELEKQVLATKLFEDIQTEKMSKLQLASWLAEEKTVVEAQYQKIGHLVNDKKTDLVFNLSTRDISPTVRERLLSKTGNISELSVELADEEGNFGTPNSRFISFKRYGALLPGEATFEERVAERGAELSTKDEGFEGMTLGEFTDSHQESEYRFGNVRVPRGQLPHEQDDFINKFIGFINTRFRPMGPMGLIAGLAHKETIGIQKEMDTLARDLAKSLEVAVAAAVRDGTVQNKADADRQIMKYLRRSGTHRELTEDEKIRVEREIAKTEQQIANNPEDIGIREDLMEYLEELEMMLEGPNIRRMALEFLPENLQEIALRSRKTIDALSQKILDQFPESLLPASERPLVEENIGRYITRSFRLFEPALGWNPRLSKLWSKESQQLIDRAIVSLNYINREDPTWDQEIDAQKFVDAVLKQEVFTSASDVARLPGILKAVTADEAMLLPGKGGLLRERFTIPRPLRQLMGEETDPALAVATSVSRIGKLLEMANLYQKLLEINDMPGEMHFSPVEDGPYSVPIKSNEFNPLEGLFTTPEFANELEVAGGRHGFFDSDFVSLYRTVILAPKAATQFGKIVLSPATQIRNFIGGGIMFLGNGHYELGSFPVAMETLRNELWGDVKYLPDGTLSSRGRKASKTYRKLQRLQLINTSVRLNDILGIFSRAASGEYNSYNQFIHYLYTVKQTGIGKVATALPAKILTRAKDFYAGADDFWKVAAWGAERIKLKKALDKLVKYSNAPSTQEEIDSQIELLQAEKRLPENIGNNLRLSEIENEIDALRNTEPGVPDILKLKVLREYAETLTTKSIGGKKVVHNQNMATAFRDVTKLEDMIDEIAAYHVRMGMPNYDYVGRFARSWRQIAIVGNFIAFPTEMARVSFNIPQIAMKQALFKISPELMEEYNLYNERVLVKQEDGSEIMENKPIRLFGGWGGSPVQKAIGFTLAAGGLEYLLTVIGQIINDISDEDIEAAKKISADYAKNDRIIPTSGMDSSKDGGGFWGINGNYILPWSDISKFWPIILKNIKEAERRGDESWDKDVLNGIWEWIVEFTDAYTDIAIAPGAEAAVLANYDPVSGQPVYNDAKPLGDQVVEILGYVWGDVAPGVYDQGAKLYQAFQEGEGRFSSTGRTTSELEALGKATGLSPVKPDPTHSMVYIVSNLQTYFKRKIQPMMGKEAAFKSGKVTEEEISYAWETTQGAWFKRQQEFYDLIQAVKLLQVNPEEYEKQMDRLGKGMGSDFIDNIEQGIFTPWEIPDSYQESFDEETLAMIQQQIKDGKDPNLITRRWPKLILEAKYDILERSKISLLGNPELPLPWEEWEED